MVVETPKSRKSGLDEFFTMLEELKRLWAWIIVAAGLPFVARLISIAPPWPRDISILTSIACVMAMVLSFHSFRTSSKKVTKRVIIGGTAVFLFAIAAYLMSFSQLVYEVPGTEVSRVKGLACTKVAMEVYQDKCPWLGELELSQSEWTAEYLWETWSISLAKAFLVGLWSVVVMSLSMTFGSFIVYHGRRRRQNDQ
jgi:hypothetical protein